MNEQLTREEMWSRQQICARDVDYGYWNDRRQSLRQLAEVSCGCLFIVDVFKGRYDFASNRFAELFGFHPGALKQIRQEGDLLEERIHPDDRQQLIEMQIRHSEFIYSLPFPQRNDYSQAFQFRMLNRKGEYVNVTSRQRVLETDCTGKAWIIQGMLDIAPDQSRTEVVKRSVLNLKTGEFVSACGKPVPEVCLTSREKEILQLIGQGLLSKEIACRLGVSIYTIHNHRKNILSKLKAGNAIEAINRTKEII